MTYPLFDGEDPHHGQPIMTGGRWLGEASAAMILIHGRGASAESILGLAAEFRRPEFAYLAPQAADHRWYPYSFLAPMDQNEPWLSSALRLVGSVVEQVIGSGISSERLLIVGFSQGGCLATEFVARNPRRYGGVAALTGGLIGPDGTPRDYAGSLEGTPVFLGTSDPDPHVPRQRVEESARVLEGMGADVDTRVYPGMGHTVNEDEIEAVRSLMDGVLQPKG
jgi:predicted esterase